MFFALESSSTGTRTNAYVDMFKESWTMDMSCNFRYLLFNSHICSMYTYIDKYVYTNICTIHIQIDICRYQSIQEQWQPSDLTEGFE